MKFRTQSRRRKRMFNRAQINELNALSKDAFKIESYWRKIHEHKQYQVVEGFKENVYYRKYENVRNPVGSIELKRSPLKRDEKLPEVPVTRPMTFDELKSALVAVIEMQNFAAIHRENESTFYEEVVKRYINGSILNKPVLTVLDNERESFDKYFAQLPDYQQEILKPYVVKFAQKGAFAVDGVRFLLELIGQNKPAKEEEVV